MCKSSVCALLLGLTCFVRGANPDDKKTTPATPEKASSPEEKAVLSLTTALRSALGETKDPEARKALVAAYSEKLLAHARKHLHDPSGMEAVLAVLRFNWDLPRSKSRLEALSLLKKEYSRSKLIQEHLREIARQSFPWEKEGCLDVIEAVYRDNPDKLTRALAARVLVNHLENRVRVAQLIQKDEKGRAGAEKEFGKDVIQGFLDRVDASKKAAQRYRVALKTELKGVLADLSIGEAAPETISEDIEGKKVKLSDCKGKVVVLDFWGTWCPPCKAMIPHARELVKKMEGKPFVFISVSVGDDKATLAAFLKKTDMPWSQWWDGHGGKARQLWNVESYPTIFVIDHKGIIRHQQEDYDPKKDDLEGIVKKLVTTAEREKESRPQ